MQFCEAEMMNDQQHTKARIIFPKYTSWRIRQYARIRAGPYLGVERHEHSTTQAQLLKQIACQTAKHNCLRESFFALVPLALGGYTDAGSALRYEGLVKQRT